MWHCMFSGSIAASLPGSLRPQAFKLWLCGSARATGDTQQSQGEPLSSCNVGSMLHPSLTVLPQGAASKVRHRPIPSSRAGHESRPSGTWTAVPSGLPGGGDLGSPWQSWSTGRMLHSSLSFPVRSSEPRPDVLLRLWLCRMPPNKAHLVSWACRENDWPHSASHHQQEKETTWYNALLI